MTTINAVFEVPGGLDPEEFMYTLEREHGIEFDEYAEVAPTR